MANSPQRSAVSEEGLRLFVSGKDKFDAKLIKRHLTCRSEPGHHGHGLDHLVSDPKVRGDYQLGTRVSNVDGDVFHISFRSL
jgi:hypothetical protein